jgi:hypothetical protein
MRAMLEGAEGLAHKNSTWRNVDADPLLRLITLASTKFECDLMPMIAELHRRAFGREGEAEGSHEGTEADHE